MQLKGSVRAFETHNGLKQYHEAETALQKQTLKSSRISVAVVIFKGVEVRKITVETEGCTCCNVILTSYSKK